MEVIWRISFLEMAWFYSFLSPEMCITNRRQHDLCKDSPASSEYSTGSSFLINKTPDKTEETEAEDKSNENVFHIYHTREISGVDEHKKEILSTAITEQG